MWIIQILYNNQPNNCNWSSKWYHPPLNVCFSREDLLIHDMRKSSDVQQLSAAIMMEWGNFMYAALMFSLIHFLKFKYNGTTTYMLQYGHSIRHVNI